MTTFYNHNEIEKKWQNKWAGSDLSSAKDNGGSKKYILDMFPYPSGDGLHVGHPESYTATDIMARYWRLKGFNVLHPMGWDAFGLPAENFAIKSGVHPKITTAKAIANFRRQIQALGFSYDWSREVNTSSPDYYRWTQWLFLQLYKKGLAYKKKAPVNWCPSCQTVLANEQVIDGKCERCGSEVIQKDLEQWFFKVTAYAEELLNKIEELDWSDALKAAQKNWIGKSEGALIKFKVADSSVIEVFTTRPDTLFGATYLVLAPEHELVKSLKLKAKNLKEIDSYILKTQSKNRLERTDLAKEKTGVELKGIKAINPANNEEIPIWLADYVLTDYGTGAIMAVPAHDARDFEFAKKYKIPIVEVIAQQIKESTNQGINKAFLGEGVLINSGKFNGLNSKEAKDKITKFARGQKHIQYKIRDWLISRQRYWGAPIPIIYCQKCGIMSVPEKDLPVLLPEDVDFKPTGESPLARSKSFHNVKCLKCGGPARRESDTMDTFVCSSWYFLRYCDPHNAKEAFNKKKAEYWLPIDLYIGGMEHAVGHLIYSRFIYKALIDMGYLLPARRNSDPELAEGEEWRREPFIKMRNQGIILAEDGRKMSKRWHNVINPDEIVAEYGADTMRLYEMFMGPLEEMKPWSSQSIIGVRRFLEKIYKFVAVGAQNFVPAQHVAPGIQQNRDIEKLLHKTIKKVTEDIENIRFNTAISAMMIFMNDVVGAQFIVPKTIMEKFLIILSPFAPHLSEELWSTFALRASADKSSKYHQSIFKQRWPEYDKKLVIDQEVTIAVQINGKLRETINVARGIGERDLRIKIENLPNVQKYLAGQAIKKFIYIQDKLVNIVV
ncbi:MAG: leucine--tRNA ligase [Candidatus Komeilibacteria bacterium]|nr:leucine--tRNA ligase [Candidatus Komeilibacteria bacterium]